MKYKFNIKLFIVPSTSPKKIIIFTFYVCTDEFEQELTENENPFDAEQKNYLRLVSFVVMFYSM